MNERSLCSATVGRRPGGTTVETKEQLLAAAGRVIATRGYEGARVSEIAAEAGLSTGAIYAHYDSKADLLCAAISSRGPDAVAGLMDAAVVGSVTGTLKFLGARLVSGMRTGRARIRGDVLIESLAASRREPKVAAVLRESIARARAPVGRCDPSRPGERRDLGSRLARGREPGVHTACARLCRHSSG